MSLHPTTPPAVPVVTAAVARTAFPRGTPYLTLRDALGPLFPDAQFAPLFARRGQPAEAPWRLALVTVLQYVEDLSDRAAADAVRADAVRSRSDWKSLLGLELTDAGFDASVLSEFRTRLVAGGAEGQLLTTLLGVCRERQLLKSHARQRTDSTHVFGAVCALNRVECVAATLRAALNALAVAAPEWLRLHSDPAWVERYARAVDDYRLPRGEAARQGYAEQIGRDGHAVLAAVAAPDAPAWLRELPAVETLRRVWVQNFAIAHLSRSGGTPGRGTVVWRAAADGFPPSLAYIASPHDADVHFAKKRTTEWIGYTRTLVHLTEGCEDDQPHLVTHVETTPAPVVDRDVVGRVHQALAAAELLPCEHLVDAGVRPWRTSTPTSCSRVIGTTAWRS